MSSEKKFSRRQFLTAAATTAATTCLPVAAIVAGDSSAQAAIHERVAGPPPLVVGNTGYQLAIDRAKGGIASFVSTFGTDRELLIPYHGDLPLFQVEFYLPETKSFKMIDSSQAKKVEIQKSGNAKEVIITIGFTAIGGLPVDARVTVRCPVSETLTYWNLKLRNGTNFWIGHIQFPVVRIPYDNLAVGDASHLLWSFADGELASPVTPNMLVGPWGGREHDTPEIWRRNNYPGQWTSTQLMAYYNDAGGLYVACDDAAGLPKFIDPMLHDDGVTMALGHYPGTQGPSVSRLPYNVILGTFHGDWYRAAEIYRGWAEKQPFCPPKIAENTSYPKWLTEPVCGAAFPMRGQGDWDPPAAINPEYTPATNALPYLQALAGAMETPLMPIVFNWERAGPWVQPDSYPALGGDEALHAFMQQAKAKGWHPAMYGDGICWVTWQKNTNYDGMPYFREHNGEAAIARQWNGSLLGDVWDWRKHYVVCVGTDKGRAMILENAKKIAAYGPDLVQEFDQSPGPRVCYATDHGHPPVPGPWMTKDFGSLAKECGDAVRSINPAVAMSCEGAPSEIYLRHFQTWDSRHKLCPLYSFLYHEYGHGFEGFMTNRVNDEALRLAVGRSMVNGYIVNYTLRDKGQIGFDWNDLWTRAVPDQAAQMDWAKRVNQFRSGIAKPYLVYGRMLRPWRLTGVIQRDFGLGLEPMVPAATWQSPDNRIATVLANCADMPSTPQLTIEGAGIKKVRTNIDGTEKEERMDLPAVLPLQMEPRSLAIIEIL